MRIKTKILMLILITSICTTRVNAQTYGWAKVASLGVGLYSVFFIDSLNGWTAHGDNGIYKTTDGGSTWIAYFGTSVTSLVIWRK